MRGFDKLEEGRSRVLVYQVGSIQIIYQDVIRWLYQVDCQMDPYQILVDSFISQWMLVESIGSSWIQLDLRWIHVYLRWIHVYLSGSQLDPCISQLDPCISQWILVGSMCIQLDPCISQQSLYGPQYIHYQILVDPCRSLVYPLVSLYTHSIPINPLYPYQSTLIHSYPPYPSILYLLISILCNRSILPSSSRHY